MASPWWKKTGPENQQHVKKRLEGITAGGNDEIKFNDPDGYCIILRWERYLYILEIGFQRRDSRMTRLILQTCNKEMVS